jgi:large subunit ribosomal protein L6
MSRVGNMPVPVPPGVEVSVDGNVVSVKGPKGELSRQIPDVIRVNTEDGRLLVQRSSDDRQARALHGLTRSLVANMITGVTQGYQKGLELIGVGYRATKSGSNLSLAVGYSKPVEVKPPVGVEFEVVNPTYILVKGHDKELVGEVAAKIRRIRPPEPYQGKGIRYVGEKVRRKEGKAGKK